MKSRIFGALAGALCAVVLVDIFRPATPYIFYNKSESAPVGWYRLTPNAAIKRDVMVAAFAPKKARNMAATRDYLPAHVPLIKTVWAAAGDEVCSQNGRVTAPNRPDIYAEAQDGLGRIMPGWTGCIILSDRQVFLVSTDVQNSWDSRYFGPVSTDNILGAVKFIGDRAHTEKSEHGRARVKGAEGKIKAGSAPSGLFPCLHIFSGALCTLREALPFCATSQSSLAFQGALLTRNVTHRHGKPHDKGRPRYAL